MITATAASSIAWLFEESVRSNSAGKEDHCAIAMPSSLTPLPTPEANLVVLNISSYLFRIVALIEFDNHPQTIRHLAKMLRRPTIELDGHARHDAYAEFLNMICGTVNRQLSTQFRHVGMSTPFFINAACADYLPTLKPAATKPFEITINQQTRFNLTVCTCVAKGKALDFNIDRNTQQDVSTGELELF